MSYFNGISERNNLQAYIMVESADIQGAFWKMYILLLLCYYGKQKLHSSLHWVYGSRNTSQMLHIGNCILLPSKSVSSCIIDSRNKPKLEGFSKFTDMLHCYVHEDKRVFSHWKSKIRVFT